MNKNKIISRQSGQDQNSSDEALRENEELFQNLSRRGELSPVTVIEKSVHSKRISLVAEYRQVLLKPKALRRSFTQRIGYEEKNIHTINESI